MGVGHLRTYPKKNSFKCLVVSFELETGIFRRDLPYLFENDGDFDFRTEDPEKVLFSNF
jgi:hypothetical protein